MQPPLGVTFQSTHARRVKQGFKIAFRERCIESPRFGGVEGISGREWWRETVDRVLYHANPGVSYTEEEFDSYLGGCINILVSPVGFTLYWEMHKTS